MASFHRLPRCFKGTVCCFQDITSSKLFHNSCVQTSFKQSKMLNKMLTKGGRKKFSLIPTDYSSPSVAATKNEGQQKVNPSKVRRAEQVSKVLFSYISDLIQYGDEDFDKIGETIEIAKVNMSPDFSALVVHWIATGTPKDDLIQQMLVKNSSKIRQHLINLRLVGTLPPITFVADFSEVQYQIVVDLLKTADMGPEGPHLSGEDLLKQQPQVLSKYVSGSLEKQINKNFYNMGEKTFSDAKNPKENYQDLRLAEDRSNNQGGMMLKDQKSSMNLDITSQVDSDLEVVNQFEDDVYLLDHSHLMQVIREKQPGTRRPSESLVLSNQNFMEEYSKIVANKKQKPKKLKEYNYLHYLREEDNKIEEDNKPNED